jgi:drug/metabolite transporter (DMT)-like permease
MGLSFKMESLTQWVISPSVLWIFATAICWGFATVLGRGTMKDIPLGVAAPCRCLVGLLAMLAVVTLNGHLVASHLNMAAFSEWAVHQDFILLSLVAGVIPLFLYFKGLSMTNASVASFFEMAQIVASLVITWGFFGQTLSLQQIVAGVFLLVAVMQINRVQHTVLMPPQAAQI